MVGVSSNDGEGEDSQEARLGDDCRCSGEASPTIPLNVGGVRLGVGDLILTCLGAAFK